MNTDNLIAAIAADGAAGPPSIAGRMAVALGIGGAISGVLFVYSLGVRPDIASALQTWRFATKLVIVLTSLSVTLWAAARLAKPDANEPRTLVVLGLPLAMLALAIAGELALSSPAAWPAWAIGSNSRLCLVSIAVLSVAPLAALLAALRAGAPRSPAMAGAVAGLLAGCLAATLYATHCIDDSPLFVALWYPPPIALATLAGAIAGHRMLRW
jgi:hypothetical protein